MIFAPIVRRSDALEWSNKLSASIDLCEEAIGRAADGSPRDADRALEAQIPDCSHAPVIARLRCFRGIDTLTAAGMCAEIGDFTAFPRPSPAVRVSRDRAVRADI